MQSLNELTQVFDGQRASARLHHAWIIEGGSESSVESWLINAISSLVNKTINSDHFHPNLFWLNSADPHTVDAARLAINFLEKTSWDGGWKVCVIMAADRLNTQAQNALLKIMEEPPERSIIFLTSGRPHTLLPTLYSRGMHMVVADDGNHNAIELHTFIADWTRGVNAILEHQDFTHLFTLQSQLTDNEVDAETQSKWVFIALKYLIDSDLNSSAVPSVNWIERWTVAQNYRSKTFEFKVDQKQFCIKLTAKILE